MKIAILSNVNVDFVTRLVSKNYDVVPSVGYGNVWGQLLDQESQLTRINPNVIVFLPDIEDLLDGEYEHHDSIIDEWFSCFDSIIRKNKDYFISGVIFRNPILIDNDSLLEHDICEYWIECLKKRIQDNVNVHYLNIIDPICQTGKASVFSDKMWYIGKIPYSNRGTETVSKAIINAVELLNRTAKKVLILDLDNTLWGGVLGELGVEGIELSSDHIGAVYKKVQEQIKEIKNTGVVLAIASKNNEPDVQEVWDRHPYMLLKRDDFVVLKIDWNDKVDNIRAIASELNLGVDSFVFIDDMAPERNNIKMRMPGVAVPDFPEKVEDYPTFIEEVYIQYFKKLRLSAEDRVKTEQYIDNKKRDEAARGLSYDEFLDSLNLQVDRVELDDAKLDRIAQMHGKTNQFNLTTKRYTRQDIDRLIQNGYKVYAYNVKDKFGDYGLVVVAIVDVANSEIDSFLMSCRVMGKLIENYVIDQIEEDLHKQGICVLHAKYVPTAKNLPVKMLFENLGYSVVRQQEDGSKEYSIEISKKPVRTYFVNR